MLVFDPKNHSLLIERVEPLDRNPGCSMCKLHAGREPTTRCIPAAATRRFNPHEAILAIVDEITPQDDLRGATAVGGQGAIIRRLLSDVTARPIVYVAAIRCAHVVDSKATWNCSGYLASTIAEVKPWRIITFGSSASEAVFGTTVPVYDAIGGYGFFQDGTIVHIMPAGWLIASNRLWQRQTLYELRKALSSTPVPEFTNVELVNVKTANVSENVYDLLSAAKAITFDCEYFGKPYNREFRISRLAVMDLYGDTVYSYSWQALDTAEIAVPLLRLLASSIPKVGQSIKADVNAVHAQFGVTCGGKYFDTRFVRKLLRADAGSALDSLSYMVGMGGFKHVFAGKLAACIRDMRKTQNKRGEQLVAPWGAEFTLPDGKAAKTYAYAMLPTMYYNARDVLSTSLECRRQIGELETDDPSARVFTLVVQPATEAMTQIERWGAPVDRARVLALQARLTIQTEAAFKVLRSYGLENPNSPAQIAKLLYDTLHLKYKGMRSRSTDKKAIAKLSAENKHPVFDALSEYRKVSKLCGTYADGILASIRDDGRIHPDMKLDGAETGRMSCVEPNLQNIPRAKSELGKLIRNVFVASFNHILIEFDYSQLELRVAAMLSGDENMINIFRSGVDYHFRTAQLIAPLVWNKTAEEISKDGPERDAAKTINFSILYGKSTRAISEETGLSERVVEQIKNAIFGNFKKLAKWIAAREAETTATGYAWTMLDGLPGRHRPMFEIAGTNSEEASSALRSSYNCVDGETEALTQRGWVRGFDLAPDDILLTKNMDTEALEWQTPTDIKLWPDYEGPLVEFKSRSFSAVSTPGHRWLTTDKYSGENKVRLTSQLSDHGDHRIHRTGYYAGVDSPEYSDDAVRLFGWWLTDGTLYYAKGDKSKPRTNITQSSLANAKKVHKIDSLLSRLNLQHSRLVKRDGIVVWTFGNAVSAMLADLASDRVLPMELLTKLSRRQCKILMRTMLLGDGTIDPNGNTVFCSGSKAGAEAFQCLATLCGQAASIVCRDMSKYTPTSSKMPNVPKMGLVYYVTLLQRDTVQVLRRQKRSFTEKRAIWCPIVPNTFFVARRNGHVFVTGNTPVQGTGSDYCTRSIIAVVNWLRENNIRAKLVLAVHDSLLLEVHKSARDEVCHTVPRIMESWYSAGVPLIVDAKEGKSWGDMTSVELVRG